MSYIKKTLLFLLLICPALNKAIIVDYNRVNHSESVAEILLQSKDMLLYPAPVWKRLLSCCRVISPKKIEQEKLEYTLRYINSKKYITKVYIKNNQVVAFINYIIMPKNKTTLIHLIGVHSDHRQKGIASQLLTKALQEIAKQPIRTISLSVKKHNIGAIQLYKKFGFKHWFKGFSIFPGMMKKELKIN